MPHSNQLKRLSWMLPPEGENIEDQARGVLRCLIELAIEAEGSGRSVSPEPQNCPNCDQPVGSGKSPYCSVECREIAGFVRQFRSGLSEETIFDHDRQVALGQVLWRILGGGLPLRNTLIKPKELERLFNKYEGRCAGCGADATTVDHIGSHCNRTSNLRPMCARCGTTKPFGSLEVLGKSEVQDRLADIAHRIGSATSIRCCDDADTWDWRAYVANRKRTLDPLILGK